MNISSVNQKIQQVGQGIPKALYKAGNKIMESKWGNIAMPENPTDIAKALALYSTTTKDAVNCYYYTTQSYNNEKIPEDKRKFVAGIDLANGILNVITQLTLGLFVNKHSGEWFDKIFNGGFRIDSANSESILNKVNNFLGNNNLKTDEAGMKKALKGVNKGMKGGFGVIAVLIVTQIIAKRMIVPFLSTPLAGYFKKILESQEAKAGIKKPEEAETENLDIEETSDNNDKNKIAPDTEKKQETPQVNEPTSKQETQDSFAELVHKQVKYTK